MIVYKVIPGVVQTSVCGEYLLVAAKEAREYCPYVTEINETSAFLWQHLKEGSTLDALLDAVNEEYEIDDPEMVKTSIEGFIDEMLELGYLTTEEGGKDK